MRSSPTALFFTPAPMKIAFGAPRLDPKWTRSSIWTRQSLPIGTRILFTFRWENRWQGKDFCVTKV